MRSGASSTPLRANAASYWKEAAKHHL